MSVGKVVELWRYPVKSMMGDRAETVDVTTSGIVGDRGWAIRDEARQTIQSGRRYGLLMTCHARYREALETEAGEPGEVDITLPDGSTVASDDPQVHDCLSDYLGVSVTLWRRQPATNKSHYRRQRQRPWRALAEAREGLGLERGERMPSLRGLPVAKLLVNETLPGTHFDAAPLMIMTTSSLTDLAAALPDADVDTRRFRPNIVLDVDSPASPTPEQDWIGQILQIGNLTAKVVAPCVRCVMTTRPFADLPEDRRILRAIASQYDRRFGVYATIIRPGTVHVGDVSNLG